MLRQRSITPEWLEDVSSLNFVGSTPLVELAAVERRPVPVTRSAVRPRPSRRAEALMVFSVVSSAAVLAFVAFVLRHAF